MVFFEELPCSDTQWWYDTFDIEDIWAVVIKNEVNPTLVTWGV